MPQTFRMIRKVRIKVHADPGKSLGSIKELEEFLEGGTFVVDLTDTRLHYEIIEIIRNKEFCIFCGAPRVGKESEYCYSCGSGPHSEKICFKVLE